MAGEIIHWNINGLKNKKSPKYKDKIDTISSLLENVNQTYLINIQETHLSNNSEMPEIVRTYEHIYNHIITHSSTEDPYSGIIIFIQKTFFFYMRCAYVAYYTFTNN